MTVNQRDQKTNCKKSSKLVLVDLAGSEKVRKTGAAGECFRMSAWPWLCRGTRCLVCLCLCSCICLCVYLCLWYRCLPVYICLAFVVCLDVSVVACTDFAWML